MVEVIVQFIDRHAKGIKRKKGEQHDFGKERNEELVRRKYVKWVKKPKEDKKLKQEMETKEAVPKKRGRPKKAQ